MSSSDTGTVTYLFALSAVRPPEEALSPVAGHPGGGPLRTLRAGRVHLVVQDVPAVAFDRQALTDRLNRPEELERCALAHHRGVAAAAPYGPVVPLPLATVYLNDGNAVAAVASQEQTVLDVFARLTGRTEWAVKVHAAAPETAAEPPASSGEGGTGGGRSYLSRASARQRRERDRHETARAVARTVDRALRAHAAGATSHRPQSEQLTGRKAPQLLNAAYLVDDDRRAGFLAELRRLRGDDRLAEVDVTWSGPWVPYSFARLDEPVPTALAAAAGEGAR